MTWSPWPFPFVFAFCMQVIKVGRRWRPWNALLSSPPNYVPTCYKHLPSLGSVVTYTGPSVKFNSWVCTGDNVHFVLTNIELISCHAINHIPSCMQIGLVTMVSFAYLTRKSCFHTLWWLQPHSKIHAQEFHSSFICDIYHIAYTSLFWPLYLKWRDSKFSLKNWQYSLLANTYTCHLTLLNVCEWCMKWTLCTLWTYLSGTSSQIHSWGTWLNCTFAQSYHPWVCCQG